MIKQIANIITGCRILGSALLLFFPAFSVKFYIVYILCGLSDMIDGTVARKTNSTGGLGAKIDTVADLVFITVSMIKILPTMNIPGWLWVWGAVIAMIKIGNIIRGYVSEKQFLSLHTAMNRITGLLLFLLPLTLSFTEVRFSLSLVCAIASAAAIQEWAYIAASCKNK